MVFAWVVVALMEDQKTDMNASVSKKYQLLGT
jgi:hypothetical protein